MLTSRLSALSDRGAAQCRRHRVGDGDGVAARRGRRVGRGRRPGYGRAVQHPLVGERPVPGDGDLQECASVKRNVRSLRLARDFGISRREHDREHSRGARRGALWVRDGDGVGSRVRLLGVRDGVRRARGPCDRRAVEIPLVGKRRRPAGPDREQSAPPEIHGLARGLRRYRRGHDRRRDEAPDGAVRAVGDVDNAGAVHGDVPRRVEPGVAWKPVDVLGEPGRAGDGRQVAVRAHPPYRVVVGIGNKDVAGAVDGNPRRAAQEAVAVRAVPAAGVLRDPGDRGDHPGRRDHPHRVVAEVRDVDIPRGVHRDPRRVVELGGGARGV